MRWAVEYRDDILQWVSHDFFIQPVTEAGITRCPFLEKLKGVYICHVYDTRPKACARFPISRRQAERIGCPGVEQTEEGDVT